MLHKNLDRQDIHKVISFVYNNQSERENATGLISTDVEKLARQLDDDSIWLLKNHNPVTWEFLGGGGASTHNRAHSLTSNLDHTNVDLLPIDGDLLKFNGSKWISLNTYVHNNEIHVNPNSGNDSTGNGTLFEPYKTIKHAISTIIDNSINNRYEIILHGGNYSEDNPIELKEFVSISSLSSHCFSKIVASNLNLPIIKCLNKSHIQKLELYGATSSPAIVVDSSGCCSIDDILITNCQYGIHVNNVDAKVNASNIIISDESTTINTAIKCTQGKLNLDKSYILDDTLIVDNYIYIDGPGILEAHNIYIDTTNVDRFCYVNNENGIAKISSSTIKDCRIGLHIDSSSGTIITNNIKIKSREYDIKIDSSNSTFIGNNVTIDRSKISIPQQTNVFSNFGFDTFSNKTRILSNTAIGRSDLGYNLEVGNGSPYIYNTKLFKFDGANFTEIHTLEQMEFPNTSAGSCMYFGDLYDKFYAIGYKILQSISLGSGDIVWEYYDSGSSSWVQFDTLNTIEFKSITNANESFIDSSGSLCTIRFDQNIKIGVKENNSLATGWGKTNVNGVNAYWIRCRILSNISISPIINNVKFKRNYTQIRKNGTQSYHGECRYIKIKPIELGAGVSGSTSNQTVSISQKIDIPLRENKFVNGATDKTYFRLILPDNIDTSWGLRIKIEWCTQRQTSSDEKALIHLTNAFGCVGSRFDGNAQDFEQICEFKYNSGENSWIRRISVFDKRVNISKNKPGDTVFFELKRLSNESNDTLNGNVVVTNGYIEYRIWQTGVSE